MTVTHRPQVREYGQRVPSYGTLGYKKLAPALPHSPPVAASARGGEWGSVGANKKLQTRQTNQRTNEPTTDVKAVRWSGAGSTAQKYILGVNHSFKACLMLGLHAVSLIIMHVHAPLLYQATVTSVDFAWHYMLACKS